MANGAMIHLLLRILHHGISRYSDAGAEGDREGDRTKGDLGEAKVDTLSVSFSAISIALILLTHTISLFHSNFFRILSSKVHRDVLRLTQEHFHALRSLQILGRLKSTLPSGISSSALGHDARPHSALPLAIPTDARAAAERSETPHTVAADGDSGRTDSADGGMHMANRLRRTVSSTAASGVGMLWSNSRRRTPPPLG